MFMGPNHIAQDSCDPVSTLFLYINRTNVWDLAAKELAFFFSKTTRHQDDWWILK